MKNIVFVFVVAVAFCTMAMASDIAFYVGQWNTDGWYGPEQFEHVETIIAETGHLFEDIQQFDDDQFDEFGAWVDENTEDGEMDIIWLNGCMPSVLYPNPNRQPDGSRAEEWLDGGNMIINVGDLFAAVTFEGGSRQADNSISGAANILDLSSGIFGYGGGTQMTVTPTGKEYLPSLNDPVVTRRPLVLLAVRDPWEVAAIFASRGGTDDAAVETQAEPVVIHNTETGGYLAIINQAARGHWIDDRGLTCAEFINNWVNTVIGLGVNPYASRPHPKEGVIHALYEDTWVDLSWKPGALAVSHDVYFGENVDDVKDGAESTFQGNQTDTFFVVGFPGFAYPDGLVPGTTYYWRVDEVNDTEPNSPWIGDVWSFSVPPKTAYFPNPADGADSVDVDIQLSWTAGFGSKMHTVYFGDNFDDVNSAVMGILQTTTTYTPSSLAKDTTYYWRIDEFDSIETHKGNVWSFKTLPDIPITDPNLVGWWKFDEGHGTTSVDWSGHDNHGILNGTHLSWMPDDGMIGGALSFDGPASADDYVVIPTADISLAAGTVALWGKLRPDPQWPATRYFFGHTTIPAWNNRIQLYMDDSDTMLDLGLGNSHARRTDIINLTTETWYHVALTWDGGHYDVYVNGEKKANGSYTGLDTLNIVADIGNDGNPVAGGRTEAFNGLLDNVRIYNVALSAEEIEVLEQ